MPVIRKNSSFYVCLQLKQFPLICMPAIGTVPLRTVPAIGIVSLSLNAGYWNTSSLFVCRLLEQFLFIFIHAVGTVPLNLCAGF